MDVCAEWRAGSGFTLERQTLILKDCACASQGITAGMWVSLENWGCWCTEKPLAAGCCAQIPEELDSSQAPDFLASTSGWPWLLWSQWEFCICYIITNNAKESSRCGTAGAALEKGLQTAPKQPVGEDPEPWLSSVLESAPTGCVQPGSSSLSLDKSSP